MVTRKDVAPGEEFVTTYYDLFWESLHRNLRAQVGGTRLAVVAAVGELIWVGVLAVGAGRGGKQALAQCVLVGWDTLQPVEMHMQRVGPCSPPVSASQRCDVDLRATWLSSHPPHPPRAPLHAAGAA